LAILSVTLLLICIKIRGAVRLLTVYSLLVFIFIGFREMGMKLMLRTYAAGFKAAAFKAASASDWCSLLPIARTWISTQQKTTLDSILPTFPRKVYAQAPPYYGVSGDITPGLRDLRVTVLWRQPTFVVAIEVGARGKLNGELYREEINDQLSVIISRGG